MNIRLLFLIVLLPFGILPPARAYPPAPPHTIYGLVRGEDGEPLTLENAQIILETTEGVKARADIVPGLDSGINYRLTVRMDAGVTPDLYIDAALIAMAPFQLKVQIGTTTYLPMEMSGGFQNLGEPGKSTRIDLTLGEDSDGDGLPDGWEQILIDQLGGGLTLADITPGGDSDNDRMTNLQEYLAGTYAFDAQENFTLLLKEQGESHTAFEFLVIPGRTYEILRSTDLKTWTAVPFRVPALDATLRSSYQADDVETLRIEVPLPASPGAEYYYRGQVQ